MPTAGTIIANVRTLYGDPDRDWLTDSIGLDFLNQAQIRYCHKVMPLDEYQGFGIVAKVNRYSVNADCIIPVNVMWYQSRTVQLDYVTPSEWIQLEESHPNATGTPTYYAFVKRQLYVGPEVPQTVSATALASGAGFASATAIALTAASGTFRSKGFLRIGSAAGEVIEYNTVDGATISGITRGVHNTTAASIASSDQFTQIDLIMQYRKSPAVITATTANPDVPTWAHPYLEKYMLYLSWMARGDMKKADRAFAEFEQYEKDSIKTVGRRTMDGMVRIVQRKRNRNYW